jgi:hypothetical protein
MTRRGRCSPAWECDASSDAAVEVAARSADEDHRRGSRADCGSAPSAPCRPRRRTSSAHDAITATEKSISIRPRIIRSRERTSYGLALVLFADGFLAAGVEIRINLDNGLHEIEVDRSHHFCGPFSVILEHERLREKVDEQAKQVADAEKQIADLERQLALRQQNSTTTSKPPSSDGLAGSNARAGARRVDVSRAVNRGVRE